jgi:hypothetical protein
MGERCHEVTERGLSTAFPLSASFHSAPLPHEE